MKATTSLSATSLAETYLPLKSDFPTGARRSSDVTWRAGMPGTAATGLSSPSGGCPAVSERVWGGGCVIPAKGGSASVPLSRE